MKKKTAVIIGGGPAGLTAAYELAARTDIHPIVLEMDGQVGGISRTVNYKGNRIDIGGHRFFSKSQRVTNWWLDKLPLQENGDDAAADNVMLTRSRLSRIYYLGKFFDYPVTLNMNTVANLGLWRMAAIGLSYLRVKAFPIRQEASLEDFLINRFGRQLYRTFFKDYTEKVWGVSCRQIKPEWGAQRIKGLSVSRAVFHALRNLVGRDTSITQKKTETSLIERFLYPKFGPGQMWETVAGLVEGSGGEVLLQHKVCGLRHSSGRIDAVRVKNLQNNEERWLKADYVFSTMPVKELIQYFGEAAPSDVRTIANGLVYRDFVVVGLLLNRMLVNNDGHKKPVRQRLIPDNWIYMQDSDLRMGRLQVFNNWSPFLVKDPQTVWLGLEYFCNEGDELWRQSDEQWRKLAAEELRRIGFIEKEDVLDGVVIRMSKTYPAYFGAYEHFERIRRFVDGYENLFLIGRNGMHRYNNQDHSMLTAMTAVDNIIAGINDKANIWAVNTETEYHEEKQ